MSPRLSQERLARIVVGIVLFLLVVMPLLANGVGLLVDWLWFGSEGFRSVYLTIIKAEIGLSSFASLGFMAVVALNLLLAGKLARRHAFRVYGESIEIPMLERFRGLFQWALWLGVVFVGYLLGEWASSHWLEYQLAAHASAIGQAEPLFGLDVGFYLFHLPFRWFLYHWALVTLILSLLASAFGYLVGGGVWVTPRGPVVGRYARIHLMAIGALIFLLIAYRFRLAMYGLLYSSRGVIYGAAYTDVHASLPIFWALLVLAILVAAGFAWGAMTGKLRPALVGVLALILVGLIGGSAYPEIVQRFSVKPNEFDKERPYIETAIKFTRQAYALDRFEDHHFSAVEDLSLNDIRQNDATLRNVRLWDHKPLLTTFAQLQEIRTYYDFTSVDNDRYRVNGVYRQVSLSPRELSSSSLPSRTWINEHLAYTHGYGLCLSPVNEITSDGLPAFFVKDIPPASNVGIKVSRPEIYFGETSNDYCFVDTNQKEFDYPNGDQNVYTNYEGSGGIEVKSLWRRILFSLNFGEFNVLLSGDIRPESRLMIYRQIQDRVTRLIPFLSWDSDPYMVISGDGSLYWMLDGYTTSSRYPYSDPSGDMGNYIRNSVKATVNAYTGQVRFYVSDPTDVLIQAYAQIFPGVFQPLSAMPEDLRAHIRYPEDFFTIQAAKYAVFHMTDPRVFYNKEDLWRVAQSAARGQDRPMSPYYTIMKLAEVGNKEEFILMVPFTPARKQNMIAWMAARCDAPDYGKLVVFNFPKDKLVYGPQQVESRIDQDPAISQQLTLWSQGGSTVIRGTLLVTPVLNSVLYIEPLYLAAEHGGGLPQLKRVIVAYSDRVVMESTLDTALTEIFGGNVSTATQAATGGPAGAAGQAATPGQAPPLGAGSGQAPGQAENQTQVRALAREANQHFLRAQELLRQGNWSGYGDEMKKVGELINKMAQQ